MTKRKSLKSLLALLIVGGIAVGSWAWWQKRTMPDVRGYEKMIDRLKPLHREMGPVRSGDWLASHDEPGQTFREYVQAGPVTPTELRSVLYIQPLGDFTDKQREIIDAAAQYLGLCYNLPVKISPDIPLEKVPGRARRTHPSWGVPQILTTYVLEDVLAPNLPDDAAASICFTASDLWPGKGWNFVFGQASLSERVGVWSIYRKGDPHGTEDEFRMCLLRTIKTAAHETGHMFSIRHCTAYECTMCGSNSLEESDRRPLAMCPECVAKVCFATKADAIERFAKLETFCRDKGLVEEADFFQRSQAALSDNKPVEDNPVDNTAAVIDAQHE